MTTSADGKGASSGKTKKDQNHSKVSEDLRKEDNVIFLPTADEAKKPDDENRS
jgi:hypothetical protein